MGPVCQMTPSQLLAFLLLLLPCLGHLHLWPGLEWDGEQNEKVTKDSRNSGLLYLFGQWLHRLDRIHGDPDIQASRYQITFVLFSCSPSPDVCVVCFTSRSSQ